jgi:uncharacterized membrane protein
MSMVSGLPAHPLLVHFIVVLAPLAAILAILCAIWPAARQRLVWLVFVLAGVNLVLTPIAAEAGEWLYSRVDESEALETHEHLGETMLYFSLALMAAAILLAISHVRAGRGKALPAPASAIIAVFVVVAAVATSVQVYRVGHSGAESVWGDALTSSPAGESESE